MKEEFIRYLQSLGLTDVLLPRCDYVFRILSDTVGEEILDIFVSEYFEEDGKRYYEDFRVFTETTCLVASNFLHEDKFAIWNLESRYHNINFRSTNYDYKKATALSRLALYGFSEGSSGGLILKASGENCDHLYKLFKKYFIPHLTS